MSALGKMGILVALLTSLPSESTTIRSQLSQVTEETFNLLDQDRNGTVSREEYVVPHLKRAEEQLRIDAWIESGGPARDLGWHGGQSNVNKKERFSKVRFWRLDSNRDGALSSDEFKNFLMSEDSPHRTDQEALFSELDQDQDEELSYKEFKREMDREYSTQSSSTGNQNTDSTTDEVLNQGVADTEEQAIKVSSHDLAQAKKRIEKRFESRDANGDFVLTVDEFLSQQRISEIHSQVMDASFETMDVNDDNAVSQDEFNADMKTRLHERVAANDKIESKTERREAHSAMEQRLIRSFKNLDSNDDGQVTQIEMNEYQDRIYVSPLVLL